MARYRSLDQETCAIFGREISSEGSCEFLSGEAGPGCSSDFDAVAPLAAWDFRWKLWFVPEKGSARYAYV